MADPIWLKSTDATPSAEDERRAVPVHVIGGAGTPGPEGPEGPQGPKGDPGAPGTDGTNGTTPPVGTAAMLTAGTDTVNRSWSAKDIAEYVASKVV